MEWQTIALLLGLYSLVSGEQTCSDCVAVGKEWHSGACEPQCPADIGDCSTDQAGCDYQAAQAEIASLYQNCHACLKAENEWTFNSEATAGSCGSNCKIPGMVAPGSWPPCPENTTDCPNPTTCEDCVDADLKWSAGTCYTECAMDVGCYDTKALCEYLANEELIKTTYISCGDCLNAENEWTFNGDGTAGTCGSNCNIPWMVAPGEWPPCPATAGDCGDSNGVDPNGGDSKDGDSNGGDSNERSRLGECTVPSSLPNCNSCSGEVENLQSDDCEALATAAACFTGVSCTLDNSQQAYLDCVVEACSSAGALALAPALVLLFIL